MINLKSVYNERLDRLKVRKYFKKEYNEQLIEKIKKNINVEDLDSFSQTIDFVYALDFNHPGLSSHEYINHPLRMTLLISQFNNDIELIKLSLMHNILEVSDINDEHLKKNCSQDLIDYLKILKVDRNFDRDLTYKSKYYKDISSSSKYVGIVKAIDKFDNLFLLCLNADYKIRKDYLEEIERFVIPIVKENIIFLLNYYLELVNNCKEIGFLNQEKCIRIFGKNYI